MTDTLPETMRAAALDRFGGPEVLTIHSLPVPVPSAYEVVIAVHYAELGTWDEGIRESGPPSGKRPRFPYVLGAGGSGTIAALGSRVRRFKIGERVYAYQWDNPKGGFYAEYVAVAPKNAAPMPSSLDFAHAGAVPAAGSNPIPGGGAELPPEKGARGDVPWASCGVGAGAPQFG